MDDCNLKSLTVSPGTLEPTFKPDVSFYKVTVGSDAERITVHPVTSGASYQIVGADSSKAVSLNDGVNKIEIEVAAEDGTLKRYEIEATKLSLSSPTLSGLKIAEKLPLDPTFSLTVYEYTCMW